MNRIITLVVFSFLLLALSQESKAQCNDELVNICALSVGDNAVYMKDFRAKLPRAKRNQAFPFAKYTIVLNRGTHYRLTLCNATDFEGEAIMQLYDDSQLLGSTIDLSTGREFNSFDFMCQKTDVYQIFISFKEGKEGCAVGILSMVR